MFFFSRWFVQIHVFFTRPLDENCFYFCSCFEEIRFFSLLIRRNVRLHRGYLTKLRFAQSFYVIRVFSEIIWQNLIFSFRDPTIIFTFFTAHWQNSHFIHVPLTKFAFHPRPFDEIRILFATLSQNLPIFCGSLTKLWIFAQSFKEI